MKYLALFAAASVLATAAHAQAPQPAVPTPPIAAPQDVAYPGVIQLTVDATDLDRRIFKVRETIPVAQAGRMTLLYPQWLPGNHAPRGPVDKIGGLTIRAGDRTLAWTRDPVNVHAFHVDVPAGVSALDVEFQFLTPTATSQGRVVVTQEMLNLQWNATMLYPAGYYASRITVQPTVILPEGWKYGVALDTASSAGGTHAFKPVSLETLVDSPMFAGRYFRQVDLDPGGKRPPVRLNMVADSPELLEAKPEHMAAHVKLVEQADRLFGTRQFDRYDFLLAVTDRMGGIGLEHHRSSENGVEPGYFTEWAKMAPERDLLPHEYTHSWNGKFRRGADAWTPNYDVPMRNSLLWVYEGQTQYWGYVLSARSGLLSKQETLDALAATAAIYDLARVGRAWRPLVDTTNDPIVTARRPQAWTSWQRNEDYYSEGQLIWLDADTLIRERTGGKKSLDDFARTFFSGREGGYTPVTYTFEDVVAALNSVMPYDWTDFLRTRVQEVAPGAPLAGLERGGYRLVFTEKPTDYFSQSEAISEVRNFMYSLGFTINKDAGLSQVLWEGPAYKAGLTVGTTVVAVNGLSYNLDRLKDAITKAKGEGPGVELLVKNGDRYRTVTIDYHDGLRYPRLERIAGTPARLDAILAPRR